MFRDLQTVHNSGRYLSPRANRTSNILCTPLTNVFCILRFRWLDLDGADIVDVYVVKCAWPFVRRLGPAAYFPPNV